MFILFMAIASHALHILHFYTSMYKYLDSIEQNSVCMLLVSDVQARSQAEILVLGS